MSFRCAVEYFVNDLPWRECACCVLMDDTALGRLMNWGIGLLIKNTLTVWKNRLAENSWSLSSMKDGRGKFTHFPVGRKEEFLIPFHYRTVKVAYRMFQWLKNRGDALWTTLKSGRDPTLLSSGQQCFFHILKQEEDPQNWFLPTIPILEYFLFSWVL